MKLHWSPRSPFVRKVMIFAHEVGLAARIEPVRTVVAMSQANRDLLKVNPVGKIPTLITDEGEALYDSTVICEYLDSLHSGARYFPQAPRERWRARTSRRASWSPLSSGRRSSRGTRSASGHFSRRVSGGSAGSATTSTTGRSRRSRC